MKIAFVVSFFDFRNDVRRVMREVACKHEVIVFGNSSEENMIRQHLPADIEFRAIDERGASIWNAFWQRAYLLFKKLPKSRSNYFLMELFKAGNLKNDGDKKKALDLLKWSRLLPKFISYDFYLNRLHASGKTRIDGIDHFLFFTAVSDDLFLSRLIAAEKSVSVYVYSWDHPCKHTCFSKRVRYLCWTKAMMDDVVYLQNIPEENVSVIGASQLAYIDAYRRSDQDFERHPFKFIYFGCAIGITELVPSEIKVIQTLATMLADQRPEWKLVLRPYPVLSDWRLYEGLRMLPNVVFDDKFKGSDSSINESEILRKYAMIDQAEAFFHLGTTMGLEACFTQTPSFIVDFGYTSRNGLSLYNFIHQYQNDKHLIALAPQNSINSVNELEKVLEDLKAQRFRLLNLEITRRYDVKSFETFSDDLVSAL